MRCSHRGGADPIEKFNEDHFRAEALINGAELYADDAGADDEHLFRDLFKGKRTCGGEDFFLVEGKKWKRNRFGAGGEEDVLGRELRVSTWTVFGERNFAVPV